MQMTKIYQKDPKSIPELATESYETKDTKISSTRIQGLLNLTASKLCHPTIPRL